eukprot:Nk52_evm32s272 gene=Nk52_evmTU32s272
MTDVDLPPLYGALTSLGECDDLTYGLPPPSYGDFFESLQSNGEDPPCYPSQNERRLSDVVRMHAMCFEPISRRSQGLDVVTRPVKSQRVTVSINSGMGEGNNTHDRSGSDQEANNVSANGASVEPDTVCTNENDGQTHAAAVESGNRSHKKGETVEVKLTRRGMYTKDAKMQKMDNLMRFFQQQNSTPKFTIRVWGYHYRGEVEGEQKPFKGSVERRSAPNMLRCEDHDVNEHGTPSANRSKSSPNLSPTKATVGRLTKGSPEAKIVDFSYMIDATHFVDDHGKLCVAKETLEDGIVSGKDNLIKQSLKTYLESDASMKEISLRKKVKGNFPAIRSLVTHVLKDVYGYRHHVQVDFSVEKASVSVKRNTKAAQALNSRPLAFAGIMSIIGAAAIPLAKKVFLKKCVVKLDSEFTLKLAPEDLVMAIEEHLHI